MLHFPATSARLIFAAAGAVFVVDEVVDATTLELSTAALSFLAQAAMTNAQQASAERVMRGDANMWPPRWMGATQTGRSTASRTYGHLWSAASISAPLRCSDL